MLWYMNSVPPACETCDPWPVKSTGSSACFACIAFLHLRQDSFLACGATRPVMRAETVRDHDADPFPDHIACCVWLAYATISMRILNYPAGGRWC